MRLALAFALSSSLAAPVLAQTPAPALSLAEPPITAAEFEAFVTGKTLNYATDGAVFGTEFYQPNRRVLWAFTADECHEGRWYPKDDAICFAYDDLDGPQCWLFFQNGTRMTAQFVGPDGLGTSADVTESASPLSCLGPDIGV